MSLQFFLLTTHTSSPVCCVLSTHVYATQLDPSLLMINTCINLTPQSQDRFISLALLYVHRDIQLDYDQLIDTFAARKPRRMLMCNALTEEMD